MVYKPPCSASVYEELLPSNQLNSHIQHISQLHLSPGGVFDVLYHLDASKATGPDKILAKLLKNCSPCIANSLCAIFNKSLYLGELSAAWKVANIIPIPESGLRGEVSNYRPISLLPIVSKVMESCILAILELRRKLVTNMSRFAFWECFARRFITRWRARAVTRVLMLKRFCLKNEIFQEQTGWALYESYAQTVAFM